MTTSRKIFMPVMAFTIAMALFSCKSGGKKEEPKKAEETPVAVFTPFKVIMIHHPVADYDKWKIEYLANDSMRQAYGISQFVIGTGIEDPKMVTVIDKITDVQKAKDFSVLPGLKDAMKKAGVTGPPEIDFAEVIRFDSAGLDQKNRVMIKHHVKDFDAWMKVYDGEGPDKRKGFGLQDRAIARGIDDPNTVYITFVINDMDKAKARMNSPELKKLMTDAGVDGPPALNFYTIVDLK